MKLFHCQCSYLTPLITRDEFFYSFFFWNNVFSFDALSFLFKFNSYTLKY